MGGYRKTIPIKTIRRTYLKADDERLLKKHSLRVNSKLSPQAAKYRNSTHLKTSNFNKSGELHRGIHSSLNFTSQMSSDINSPRDIVAFTAHTSLSKKLSYLLKQNAEIIQNDHDCKVSVAEYQKMRDKLRADK